jgi:hypothetical protein
MVRAEKWTGRVGTLKLREEQPSPRADCLEFRPGRGSQFFGSEQLSCAGIAGRDWTPRDSRRGHAKKQSSHHKQFLQHRVSPQFWGKVKSLRMLE